MCNHLKATDSGLFGTWQVSFRFLYLFLYFLHTFNIKCSDINEKTHKLKYAICVSATTVYRSEMNPTKHKYLLSET